MYNTDDIIKKASFITITLFENEITPKFKNDYHKVFAQIMAFAIDPTVDEAQIEAYIEKLLAHPY